MRLYVSLDSREIVVGTTLNQRVSTIFFTRGDTLPLEVQFVRDGAVVELDGAATGKCGVKAAYGAADFLAYDSAWAKTGTGTSTIYQFDLSLNTAEVEAAFSADPESIAGLVELEWTIGSTITSTLPTTATIYNAIITGAEGDPLVTTSASQFRLMSPNGTVWGVALDNSGVLASTVLSGVTAGPSAIPLVSPDLSAWTLTIDNTGTITTTAS
jgi:hypothetical protein